MFMMREGLYLADNMITSEDDNATVRPKKRVWSVHGVVLYELWIITSAAALVMEIYREI